MYSALHHFSDANATNLPMNLFDAATQNGCVKRLGELTIVSLALGHGGMVMDAMDFLLLRKWAQRRASTENPQRDMQLFLDHIELAIARTGSALPTRGHASRVLQLAKKLKGAGMNLSDWNIPRDIIDELTRHPTADDNAHTQTVNDSPRRRSTDNTTDEQPVSYSRELERSLAVLGLHVAH